MDLKKIEQLIQALEASQAAEITVRKGESSVRIRRGPRKALPKRTGAGASRVEISCSSDDTPGESCIRSPMVGLFHSVDGLTEVGARIKAGQVVGAIESMKLLNDIVSDVSGTVVESLVEDGMPVEYNQILCKVKHD